MPEGLKLFRELVPYEVMIVNFFEKYGNSIAFGPGKAWEILSKKESLEDFNETLEYWRDRYEDWASD